MRIALISIAVVLFCALVVSVVFVTNGNSKLRETEAIVADLELDLEDEQETVVELEGDIVELKTELLETIQERDEAHFITIPSLEMELTLTEREVSDLELDKASLEDELFTETLAKNALKSQVSSLTSQLNDIQAVYPLREFRNLSQLRSWAMNNIMPYTSNLERWYCNSLTVQYQAMMDGYMVSVDVDYASSGVQVWLVTCINGQLYYWDVEVGTIHEYVYIGTGYQTT